MALLAGKSAWHEAGLDPRQIARLNSMTPDAWARSLDWLSQPGHHLLGWHDPAFPPLLRHSRNPPLALFVEGDPDLLWRPMVAVVGSRSPTPVGREHATRFARALAQAGIVVASGLATGVDAAAHRATIEVPEGLTVAVVGTGLDQTYPHIHASLQVQIAERGGAIVSEFPPGTPARAPHFPSRNRILAGLSAATLVIEAAERSGALITARLAGDDGRDVFALPGSLNNPLARGCHRLIRQGAGLISSPEELLEEAGPGIALLARTHRLHLHEAERAAAEAIAEPLPARMDDYHPLWAALGHDPTGMDQLVERTGLTAAQVSSMLLLMELDGRVAVEHGRYWRKS